MDDKLRAYLTELANKTIDDSIDFGTLTTQQAYSIGIDDGITETAAIILAKFGGPQ
jgi:hypothetical protein